MDLGRTAGKAEAILAVLRVRGIDLDAEAVARITGETDLGRLETWLVKAVTAQTLREVFEP